MRITVYYHYFNNNADTQTQYRPSYLMEVNFSSNTSFSRSRPVILSNICKRIFRRKHFSL